MAFRTWVSTMAKEVAWSSMRPFHASDAWPLRVRSGPAKGLILNIDVRQCGSYWLGTYDQWILDHVRISDWLPQGGIAWDCGAFVGYYTALFRRCVGNEGQVFGFEASARNFARLRGLPKLNHWSNVEILHFAVGRDHQSIEFEGGHGGASGPIETKQFQISSSVELVQSVGIDEMVYEYGKPAPDFLKLDLEGAEIFALKNGSRVFQKKRPVMLLELHGKKALESFGEFLVEFEYCGWDVREFNQIQAVPLASVADVAKEAKRLCNTVVCLPAERRSDRERSLNAVQRRAGA
jgi:FkbM family methyltransferase